MKAKTKDKKVEQLKNNKKPATARPKRRYNFPVHKRTVEAESYAEALKIINNK